MAKKDDSKKSKAAEKKSVSKKDSKKKDAKKNVSMRESAAQSRDKAVKPKRVRKAAESAGKPISKTANAATKQRHVYKKSGTDSFLHKERSLMPRWLLNAWRELRQVTWPTWSEAWRLVIAVFIFSALLSGFIFLLDNALETIFRNVFL